MADRKHGNTDITAQEKTFEGFVGAVAWCVGVILLFLVLLAMFNA